MTTPGPENVKYTFFARIGSTDLPVNNIIATQDRDRMVYTEATIECGWVDDATFAALNPRNSPTPRVSWNVLQLDGDTGATIGYLPNRAVSGVPVKANMWVREATRNDVTGTTTVRVAGGESMMDDKVLLEYTPWDTGAWDVRDLVWWSMDDVFGSYSITLSPLLVAEPVPAGERSHMNPGQNHFAFLQPELDSLNCRLRDDWGIWWYATDRSKYTATVDLSSYPLAGSDHIVYECSETITRDDDWADGVAILYDMTKYGGSVVGQRSSLGGVPGANTRGLFLNREHGEPANNGAQLMAARTRQRGYNLVIVARCRFDFDAQWQIDVNHPGGRTRSGNIRSIEWDIGSTFMVIRAQSGDPL